MRHQPLRVGPGALAHLNLADVGQQPLGAPAQNVLLDLDIDRKPGHQHQCRKANDPQQSAPACPESHTWVDTAPIGFVPAGQLKQSILPTRPFVINFICDGNYRLWHSYRYAVQGGWVD